ncbi:1,4-dihydroxy-2-naphthoate polyprenyltransferase [Propioniciclava coleopterorum]|uniref:1,4-dihydroxy-2-naphthoate octaprenyltransferase n=1 Tax=Propioniciclava coleopterorum TaxID=2714937 RepID=A0A6G7Y3W2_9ACTN|nr:1,4-dihydroxy-2-naphthoate polyprenyltransferase [Propioniciclava coleopterorum]QIK71502.1 1,4-dihydroxy-2-naphthoate polyprenyltransferase [Propioniciclava coleopterorum]
MATTSEWVKGARLRTLPAAIAPVLAGTAVAIAAHGFRPLHAALALVVALALQVGVNYANDYSDGIRGTDDERVGPLRLVGSGAATPQAVKRAAFGCFGLAGVVGLALVVLTGQWWLLALGAACILAAWFYTGGTRPYGYAGLGEAFVFVFFGLVAVAGTTYVQLLRVPATAWAAGVFAGALSAAVLVTNNLRDRAGDAAAGKRTLAVRLGDGGTRSLYAGLVALGALGVVGTAAGTSWWVLLGLVGFALLVRPVRDVLGGADGRALIPTLKATGLAELAASVGILVGAVIGA